MERGVNQQTVGWNICHINLRRLQAGTEYRIVETNTIEDRELRGEGVKDAREEKMKGCEGGIEEGGE